MIRGPLALKIAWRYLMAPKAHGAVSAITIVSMVGVAVATAAIIIVLSVFNGFRYSLNTRLDTLTCDIRITPAMGKTFAGGDSLASVLAALPGVETAMPELTDNALVIASSKEMPITLKGVDMEKFTQITTIDSLLLDGTPLRGYNDRQVSVSVGVAQRLGLYGAGDSILLFAPKRIGRVNMANPMASFLSDSIEVGSVFRSMQNEFDENTVVCDISTARRLFQYDDEASAIQLKAERGVNLESLTSQIQAALGDDFIVKDRQQQQAVSFRMVAIEKWITFTLLTFILIIASFNIISTLSMLILDKGASIRTLSHIGMRRRRIGNIFWWESLLVTLFGAVAGIILGVLISLIQEKFGVIKLAGDPDSLVMLAYPVRLEWLDIGITMIPIAVIGLISAWISHAFARSRVPRL